MTSKSFRRLRAVAAFAFLPVTACSSWQRVGTTSGPSAGQQLLQSFDPAAMYLGLGRLVSADGVEYTGSVAYIPGKGDSTQAIIALSVSNHSLGFLKTGDNYTAKYKLEYSFTRSGSPPVTVTREESVRVASFQETMRVDESLLLQQVMMLAPGNYTLNVRLSDLQNNDAGLSRLSTTVPVFAAGSVTAPILVYDVLARRTRNDSLKVVLNPRGTVAYGGDTIQVYVEGVGFRQPTDVPLRIRDDRDSVIFQEMIHFVGTGDIEGFTVFLTPDKAPLGKIEMITGTDTVNHINRAVVSFSQSWIVTNFTDLLDMLKFFGEESRVNAMRKAKPEARSALWREFNRQTDPNLATPENEALERYFSRLAYANYRFRDEVASGWRTDRGEAYILLGEPDEVVDHTFDSVNRYYIWSYRSFGGAQLVFQDETGFNRFRLTPESRAALDILKMQVTQRR